MHMIYIMYIYIETESYYAGLGGLELGAILHMSWCWITGVWHHTWPTVGTICPSILVILSKYQYLLVLLHVFTYCVCVWVYVLQHVYEIQKTVCRNWSSPSTMCVLGLELWYQAHGQVIFTPSAILLTPVSCFHMHFYDGRWSHTPFSMFTSHF